MHVWILYSYENGHPTVPLAVYDSYETALITLPPDIPWNEILNGWNGKGHWSGTAKNGAALELVQYEVII